MMKTKTTRQKSAKAGKPLWQKLTPDGGQSVLRNLMRRQLRLAILYVFSIFVCVRGIASQPEPWLETVPSSLGREWIAIPHADFFEVPASKLPTAEYWLADRMLLVQENASYFGRADFKCAAGSALYLIRASYLNGGTGDFQVRWAGAALVVSHDSLGSATNTSKSALVACLSKRPTAIFSSIGSAL
jgi:hypothetical protein